MAKLDEIVSFLDAELRTAQIPDYSGAHNGLQLQNSGEVQQVAVAVDASLEVIEQAVTKGANLLVVHHGLFWQGVQMMTKGQYRKLKLAFDNDLAIYSSHIPLDVHPKWGNNALLAQALGLEVDGTFMDWKGIELGQAGQWQGSWESLFNKVEVEVGPVLSSVRIQENVGRLGIITGGAGSEVKAAQEAGVETFLTGEGPHWSFPLAKELGISVIHAGHYATETLGVKKVGEVVAKNYNVEVDFLDAPTGL